MADDAIGEYFIDDLEDEDDDLLSGPVVVPPKAPSQAPAAPAPGPAPAPPAEDSASPVQDPTPPAAPAVAASAAPERPAAQPARATPPAAPSGSREERLVSVLDRFMASGPEIEASALVSLDGFIMASALPADMQEDRVGAMSAAILGLGERAAAELGRGKLSQVYIEGDGGVVLLMSAGGRAVLTALADADARLGLVLYDMRTTAAEIGEILEG